MNYNNSGKIDLCNTTSILCLEDHKHRLQFFIVFKLQITQISIWTIIRHNPDIHVKMYLITMVY